VKDRVFRATLDGSPAQGQPSWFALRTDDPEALIAHLRTAPLADVRDHFIRGDFEVWLSDLYRRPDLAEGVRKLRRSHEGDYIPRAELIALLEALLHRPS